MMWSKEHQTLPKSAQRLFCANSNNKSVSLQQKRCSIVQKCVINGAMHFGAFVFTCVELSSSLRSSFNETRRSETHDSPSVLNLKTCSSQNTFQQIICCLNANGQALHSTIKRSHRNSPPHRFTDRISPRYKSDQGRSTWSVSPTHLLLKCKWVEQTGQVNPLIILMKHFSRTKYEQKTSFEPKTCHSWQDNGKKR